MVGTQLRPIVPQARPVEISWPCTVEGQVPSAMLASTFGRHVTSLSQTHSSSRKCLNILLTSSRHSPKICGPQVFRCFSQTKFPKRTKTKKIAMVIGAMIAGGILGDRWIHREKKARQEKFMNDLKNIKTDFKKSKGDKLFNKFDGFILPFSNEEEKKKIAAFSARREDIYVCSFPKSGTTWLQQIVYLIMKGSYFGQNDPRTIEQRFPYLEYPIPGLKAIDTMVSPRFIKTHLPYSSLPEEAKTKKAKILCIARNPKDISVSLYHFMRLNVLINYKGTFEECFDSIVDGTVMYGPWWDHVREYWERRNDNNVLFITYEEMTQNLPSCVKKVSRFLGRPLPEKEIQKICDQCSFQAMKENKTTNYSWWDEVGLRNKGEAEFMRKGKVGDWKNYLTPDMSARMDKMVDEKISPLGLKIVYELESKPEPPTQSDAESAETDLNKKS